MNTAGDPGSAGDGWTIVVPVKSLDRAKSRLGPALSPTSRRALVVAMATDVITACRNAPRVDRVRVVGTDPEIAQIADHLGAEFVADPGGDPARPVEAPDGPGVVAEDPLNTALARAMAGVRGPVGVIAADLPELDSRLLGSILDSASRHAHAIVADHRGHGTTMAFWTGPADRVSRFGPDSADRFRHVGGAAALAVDDTTWGEATRDVDTPEDIADLAGRRVGRATERALQGVPTPLRCRGGAESVTMVR